MANLEAGLYWLRGVYPGIKSENSLELLEITDDIGLSSEEVSRLLILYQPYGFGNIKASYLLSYKITPASEADKKYLPAKVRLGINGQRLSLLIEINPDHEIIHHFTRSQC